MKRITILFVTFVILHTFSYAALFNVNFTSSEGYVNGLLGDHEKWSVTVAWPGAWVVDAANGSVSADKTYQVAKWGQQFLLSKSGDKITFRVEFDTEIQNLQVNGAPLVFGFTSNPNIGSGVFNLVYIRKTADSYVLRNNDNSAALSPLALLPLSDIQATPSTRTKLLAVEVTLTLGDNAASSTISGRIFNVADNTSSEIGLYTGVNASLFAAATTTGIYGTFQSGIHNAQPKVYKVVMKDFSTPIVISGGSITDVELTDSELANSNLRVNSGELAIDASKTIKSIVVTPGAKLTLNNGQTLTATNGITLESDATGTATLKNNGTYSGAITAQQYLGSARNWYVSSPVVNSATPGFTTTPDFAGIDYYYEYMEAGDNDPSGQPGSPTAYWKGLNNGSTMAVGKGYIARANAGTTISFSGTPNNGNITTGFDLTRNDTKGKGFNLAGNPYPSYIDWTDVAAANPKLENTYYYRTKNIDETYAFITWNGSGNTYVNSKGGIANTTITRFIPPSQAFWVRVKSGTNATKMYFNNDMREHRDVNGNLMKAPRQDTRTSVRLQLINGTQRDELLIYQDAGASNDYDSYDSPKMMNNSTTVPDLYSMAGDEQLVINGLNSITENMELPLGFILKSAATLKMKATELNSLPEGMQVYLLDKTANTQTQLTPESEYSFTTTEATINNDSRFSLVFKSPGITTVDDVSEFNKMTVFVNAQKELVITAPENSSYAVYTMVGEQVKAGKVTENAVRINTVSQGVYLVKVNNQTSKVIIR